MFLALPTISLHWIYCREEWGWQMETYTCLPPPSPGLTEPEPRMPRSKMSHQAGQDAALTMYILWGRPEGALEDHPPPLLEERTAQIRSDGRASEVETRPKLRLNPTLHCKSMQVYPEISAGLGVRLAPSAAMCLDQNLRNCSPALIYL